MFNQGLITFKSKHSLYSEKFVNYFKLSQLLLNIYLTRLDQFFQKKKEELDANYSNILRIYYCRFASHFLLSLSGSKTKVLILKKEVSTFLKSTLHLKLNKNNTIIGHVLSSSVFFLGSYLKGLVFLKLYNQRVKEKQALLKHYKRRLVLISKLKNNSQFKYSIINEKLYKFFINK